MANQQEEDAQAFLRERGYDLIAGEANIRARFKIKAVGRAEANCADIVGFKPSLKTAFEAVICESKGTKVIDSLVQLGNAAAALLKDFYIEKQPIKLGLLVYRSSVVPVPPDRMVGATKQYFSPRGGYVLGEPKKPGWYVLMSAGTIDQEPFEASV